MTSEIEIRHVPVQRNIMDAAIELCQIYYENAPVKSVEEMQKTFLKFYAIAYRAYHGEIDLDQYLPPK